MTIWDPIRYLQFADDRSRPFVDLVGRVEGDPRSIVDLGCGPGHLSAVLRGRWPDAEIHGVDSSAEMIDKAVADNADGKVTYELADVAAWSPPEPVDLIISNALFQWVPDQLQVPNNYNSPSHRLLHEISSRGPYASHTEGLHDDRATPPEAYLDLFTRLGWSTDVWATTYLHVLGKDGLDGDNPVFDWISGTGARPILQALPGGLREEFSAEYKSGLRGAYPRRPWGTVFPFERVFAVARRTD
jgi:trans-aconitate 2-methyltransferase